MLVPNPRQCRTTRLRDGNGADAAASNSHALRDLEVYMHGLGKKRSQAILVQATLRSQCSQVKPSGGQNPISSRASHQKSQVAFQS